jgi:hypothetical protein
MNAEQKLFRKRHLIHLALLVLFIAFMVALFIRRPLEERATIRSMPEPARRATFEKELAAFQSLCLDGPGNQLAARCRERADFLQQFPECDEACRTQTDRFLAHSAR